MAGSAAEMVGQVTAARYGESVERTGEYRWTTDAASRALRF
jgi:hypothetical protein